MATTELHMDLHAPGMTALHRAGLGGLWMTLEAVENDRGLASEYRALGEWERTPHSVTIRWAGDGTSLFERLLRDAYPITVKGLLGFLADGDPLAHPDHAHTVHVAMLQSFLQHSKAKRLVSGKGEATLAVEIDGVPKALAYRPVMDHKLRGRPFGPGFDPFHPGEVVGWLLPGGTERHSGLAGATRLEEPPERLLPLRLGPIGCVFFRVRHRLPDGKWSERCAVGIPELDDLEEFALLRAAVPRASLDYLWTAGPGEAALRLLFLEAGRSHARSAQPQACEVTAFDTVAWSPQQRTRRSVVRVDARTAEPGRRAYLTIRHALPARPRSTQDESIWWSVPQVTELAAANVASGRPWWRGFADFAARHRHDLRYEQEGLHMIVKSSDGLPDSAERAFVEACHEAWRRRLGELGERARREGSDPRALFDREYERLRIRFSRAKTPADLRNAVTDFWARARAQETLQERWSDLLPFLDARKWREGRDLALLALASYGRTEEHEKEASA
jgi:CRISPR-associated protein Cas8a1/Csx13